MPDITTQLAAQITDLVGNVAVRDSQFFNWLGGEPGAGVGDGGTYPLTDYSGFTRYVPSLPALIEGVISGNAVFGKLALTRAELYADRNYSDGAVGLVITDSNAEYNGYYRKMGASGAGSWQWYEKLLSSSVNQVYAAINQAVANLPTNFKGADGATGPRGADGDMTAAKMRRALSKVRLGLHRGLPDIGLPENTMPAFKKAVQLASNLPWASYFIETDYQPTLDADETKIGVLNHNATVAATGRNQDGTAASGTVTEMTLAALKALDFGLYKGEWWRGTKIATPEELLSFAVPLGSEIWFEIKGLRTIDDVGLLVDAIKAANHHNLSYITSDVNGFNRLEAVRSQDLDIGVCAWFTNTSTGFSQADCNTVAELGGKVAVGADFNWLAANPQAVDYAKNAGCELAAFTLNSSADLVAMRNIGVSSYIIDRLMGGL